MTHIPPTPFLIYHIATPCCHNPILTPFNPIDTLHWHIIPFYQICLSLSYQFFRWCWFLFIHQCFGGQTCVDQSDGMVTKPIQSKPKPYSFTALPYSFTAISICVSHFPKSKLPHPHPTHIIRIPVFPPYVHLLGASVDLSLWPVSTSNWPSKFPNLCHLIYTVLFITTRLRSLGLL